jgi:SERRATE/Ars2, N-terminal domain
MQMCEYIILYSSSEGEMPTQPPMMTMKQYLASQDENITDVEAKKRYAEYQADFKRQQINEFFNQHKDEEW